MIAIDTSEIYKKALARQENIVALLKEFEGLDDIIAKLHEAHEKANRIRTAYGKLDDEAKEMLPTKVKRQCNVVDQNVTRLAYCLDVSDNAASLTNLNKAVKES